jgi:hypothetical protein
MECCGVLLPWNFKRRDPVRAAPRTIPRLGPNISVSIIQLHWPYPRIPIEEPMSVLVGLTLYAKGGPST